MDNIGAVLGWKFNHKAGIETRDGEITAWPTSLGTQPTNAQLNQWRSDWLSFINNPVNSETTMDDVVRALVTEGVLTLAKIDNAKRGRP